MARAKLGGSQTSLYVGENEIILPTLKPSGTPGANYAEHVDTTPTIVGSPTKIYEEYIKNRAETLKDTVQWLKANVTQPRTETSGTGDTEVTSGTGDAEKTGGNTTNGDTAADTDATATATTAAAPSPVATNDSYLNYLNGQTAYLDAAYKAETDRIDAETSDLLAQIETKRQRAVVDADSAYELNKATHGTQAERLASMGLTGSGYSDHLESRAYAASRGEVQSAKASALAAENEVNVNATNQKLAADVTYQNGLRESEAQRAAYIESKFDSLNTGAATGVYSQEQLNAYADYYGFDNSKRDVLTSSANAYQTALAKQETENNKANVSESYANRMNFIANINIDAAAYSEEDIEQAVTADVLTRDDADYVKGYIKTAQQNEAKSTISTAIASGNYDGAAEAIEDAREIIGDDACQSAYFDIVLAKCKSASTADDVLAIEAEIERLAKAGKISDADKTAFAQYLCKSAEKLPRERYTVSAKTYGATSTVAYHFTLDSDSEIYSITFNRSAVAPRFADLLDNIEPSPVDGSLVLLGKELYLYRDGWKKAINDRDYEPFLDAYMKQCSRQAKPTVPKHQSD